MRLLRHLDRVVVVLRRADLARKRDLRLTKSNFAVLVLDVELERVQAVLREGEVLVDLPRDGRERHRHVDAPDLVRIRARLRLGCGGGLRGGRLRPRGVGHVRVALGQKAGAEGRPGRGERYDGKGGGPPYRASLPGLLTPGTESFVRVNRLQKHEPRHANGMSMLPARSKND